jgi:hypothetical protein
MGLTRAPTAGWSARQSLQCLPFFLDELDVMRNVPCDAFEQSLQSQGTISRVDPGSLKSVFGEGFQNPGRVLADGFDGFSSSWMSRLS